MKLKKENREQGKVRDEVGKREEELKEGRGKEGLKDSKKGCNC